MVFCCADKGGMLKVAWRHPYSGAVGPARIRVLVGLFFVYLTTLGALRNKDFQDHYSVFSIQGQICANHAPLLNYRHALIHCNFNSCHEYRAH